MEEQEKQEEQKDTGRYTEWQMLGLILLWFCFGWLAGNVEKNTELDGAHRESFRKGAVDGWKRAVAREHMSPFVFRGIDNNGKVLVFSSNCFVGHE